jgi:hypothetical protein
MFLYGDYNDILEDSFIQKLDWLKEEFYFLFKFKQHKYNQKDRELAHQIIENFIESVNSSDDNRMHELLLETVETIEKKYTGLF